MTVSNQNPVADSLLNPADSVSFDLTPNGALTFFQVSVIGSSTEIAITSSTFQPGFVGSQTIDGGVRTVEFSRTAGWDASPFTVKVDWSDDSGSQSESWSYELAVEQLYPNLMQPRNPEAQGSLIVTDNGVQVRTDVGWIDLVGFTVADLGNGKVRVTATGGGGAVDSVFGRTGTVIAVAGDYDSDEVTNASGVSGATVSAALDALAAAIGAAGDFVSVVAAGDNNVTPPAADPIIINEAAPGVTSPLLSVVKDTDTTTATASFGVPSSFGVGVRVYDAGTAGPEVQLTPYKIAPTTDGGNFVVGNRTAATGAGGGYNIFAGQWYSDGSAQGGHVAIQGGNAASGTDGNIYIGDFHTYDTIIDAANDLLFEKPLKVVAQAAADAETTGYGQFWVRNTSPYAPMFTDDTGADHSLLSGTSKRALGNTTIGVTGSGTFDTNNATPASVTSIRMNVLGDLLGFWDNPTQDGTLKLTSVTDPDSFIIFNVTAIADVPSYAKDFTVVYRTASAAFAFSGDYRIAWVPDADAGGGTNKHVFSYGGRFNCAIANTWYGAGAKGMWDIGSDWNTARGSGADPAAAYMPYEAAYVVPFDGTITDLVGTFQVGNAAVTGKIAFYKWTVTSGSTAYVMTQIGSDVDLGPATLTTVPYTFDQSALSVSVSRGDKIGAFALHATNNTTGYIAASVVMEET